MGLLDRLMNDLIDAKLKRIMRDPYTDNLFMLVTTMQKMNPRIMMETFMRAKQGKQVGRPLGSVLQLSPWERLLLNPTYLTRLPPKYGTPMDLRVTIGPEARQPLTVELPVLVTGMSFGGALSVNAKVALAKAASAAGTATNTGEAYLTEERDAADKLIVQYIRGTWPNSSQYKEDWLKQADAIEVQVGQGAQAGTPQKTSAKKIHDRMREVYGVGQEESTLIESQLEGVQNPADFKRLVQKLKSTYPVPVGFKFGATHWMERELEIAIAAGVDYVVVDGAEAGTHAASPTLEDDTGLPTFHALVRTVNYLEKRGVRNRMSVLAGGGLRSPGEFMKAIALGADAVYIGTVALLAMLSDELAKVAPGEPATELLLQSGSQRNSLDVMAAAKNLTRYFQAVDAEMRQALTAIGKTKISEVNREDLVALDPWIAEFAGVGLATRSPEADTEPGMPGGGHAAAERGAGPEREAGPQRGAGHESPRERQPEAQPDGVLVPH